MATGNVVSLVNRALLSIGARSNISSIDEGSTESNAAAVLYTPTFESLARAAHWACLRKQANLSLIMAAQGTPENQDGTLLPIPPQPWLYAYQYPSDCLQLRSVLPNMTPQTGSTPQTSVGNLAPSYIGFDGQYNFAVAYSTDPSNNPINIILTNVSQAQGIYTVNQPNPELWDSQFQAAMVASLAAYFVPALGLNIPLVQIQIKMAEKIINDARARDGNEGVLTMDHLPDWIRARGANSGYIQYFNNNVWDNMIWPGMV